MSVFSSCPPIGCEYVRIQEACKNISVFYNSFLELCYAVP